MTVGAVSYDTGFYPGATPYDRPAGAVPYGETATVANNTPHAHEWSVPYRPNLTPNRCSARTKDGSQCPIGRKRYGDGEDRLPYCVGHARQVGSVIGHGLVAAAAHGWGQPPLIEG